MKSKDELTNYPMKYPNNVFVDSGSRIHRGYMLKASCSQVDLESGDRYKEVVGEECCVSS